MKKRTCCFFVMMILLSLAICAQASAATTEYHKVLADFSFDSVLPSDLEISAGKPEVINGQLRLDAGCLESERVRVDLGYGYDKYQISFMATAKNTKNWEGLWDQAMFSLDSPGVAPTNWLKNRIYHRSYADYLLKTDEKPHKFVYELDFSKSIDWLKIYVDGVLSYDDILINSNGDLASVRFGVRGEATLLLDDLKIKGDNAVPSPSSFILLGMGFISIFGIKRKA